jgi:hypothetical protein
VHLLLLRLLLLLHLLLLHLLLLHGLLHGLLCRHGLLCHPSSLRCEELLPPFLEPLQHQWGLWLPPLLQLEHHVIQRRALELSEQPTDSPVHVRVGRDRPLCSSEHVAHPLSLRALCSFATSPSSHGCAYPEEFVSLLKLGFPA